MSSYGQCTLIGATLRGVEALAVSVEVIISSGLPGISIVGMADTAVQEARERVRAALRSSGYSMPQEKIVVNLAPASLKKIGSGFDLPIALGILAATGQIDERLVKERLFVGELSLEGQVRSVVGILAYGICAHRLGVDLVSAPDAPLVPLDELDQWHLFSIGRLHQKDGGFEPHREGSVQPPSLPQEASHDFRDISGHDFAKRALQIAAAGSHGVLMMGPPGSGKTMLASRLNSILPPLTQGEMLEAAVVHSVAGEDVASILAGIRPFRRPHHSASLAGLVGGGNPVRPGEISLAHQGILFLDEFSEFRPSVLQGIRQPMEAGQVAITRADGNVVLPARFMLVAATNPCPCGYFGDDEHSCTCSEGQVRTYQNKIGGPLMDRIDIHLDVRRLPPCAVIQSGSGTDSATLRDGVQKARQFALWRRSRKGQEGIQCPQALISACQLSEENRLFLETTAKAFSMSGRSIMRTLSISRTIADLEESEAVRKNHIAEALSYRLREGMGG